MGKSRFRNTRMPESVSDRLRLRQVHSRKACSELISVYPIIHYTVNMPLLSMCVFTDIILIMKIDIITRGGVSSATENSIKASAQFYSSRRKGKPVRIALCCAAGLVLLVLLAMLLKPRTQLMNTPEIQRIRERGVLAVGVRDDMPLLPKAAKGLKSSLHKNSLRICFPTPPGMRRQNSSP